MFNKSNSSEELIALSQSPNGYERQRAVQKMRDKRNVIFLDALLIRANDWVPQVRNLAQQAIQELMIEANREVFIKKLELIWLLREKGRADHSSLITNISQFVLQGTPHERLIGQLRSKNKFLARIVYELLAQRISSLELIRLAVSSKDIIIIKQAAAYIDRLNNEEFDRVFEEVIGSSNAYLRCVALQVGMRKSPERIKASCMHMLLDASADIRLVSINFFRNSGCNLEEFYLEHLLNSSKTKLRAIALLGLGQARIIQVDTLKPYLSHPSAIIREAAFRTLYLIAPKDPEVRNVVLDRSPRVSKMALFLIRKNEKKVPIKELMEWFASAQSHVIKGLLKLARQLGKWDELILILKFYRKAPEIYSSVLKDWLGVFNKRQELPTPEQILAINELRLIMSESLDKDMLSELRFTLKPFGVVI